MIKSSKGIGFSKLVDALLEQVSGASRDTQSRPERSGDGSCMLTLLVEFADKVSVFNVFRYITFRTGGALITSALIVFLFGPTIINSLRLRQGKGQPIRADGPQTHFKKAGTPTMGGLMILSGIVGSSLLWAEPLQRLCLGGAAGDARLRRDRLLRRLSEGHQADRISGFSGKARLAHRIRHRRHRRLGRSCAPAQAPFSLVADLSLRQGLHRSISAGSSSRSPASSSSAPATR